MRDYVHDCLLSDNSAVRRYFNRDYIRQTLVAHEADELNYMRHINMLVSFELWHRRFIGN